KREARARRRVPIPSGGIGGGLRERPRRGRRRPRQRKRSCARESSGTQDAARNKSVDLDRGAGGSGRDFLEPRNGGARERVKTLRARRFFSEQRDGLPLSPPMRMRGSISTSASTGTP